MLRILFTTPLLEHPPAGGPALRIENSIKALHRISELHLLVRVNQATIGGPEAESFFRGQCHTFAYSPSVFGAAEIKDAEFIINYADAQQIDLIWFGYGNISFSLMKQIKHRRPELKIVCDTDSVWSRFILRELPYEPSAERRAQIQQSGFQKEQEEAEWVNFCDVTTAVSEVDADYYRGLADDPSRIHLFSNVIDPATYSERPPRPPELHKPCLYLAGSFYADSSPMARAARWMLDDILPRVHQIIPDIHFYIVGKGSREIFGHIQSPHITVTGQLPSVLPYLTHADVALVPLMFESGTRFKIMEAGICGVPLVSTTLGAEGLPVRHGRELLIADEADAFAAAIIQLVQNKPLAQRLAVNCRQLIAKFCSIDWLVQEAATIVQFLMAEQPAVQPPPHIEAWLELGKRHYHLGQYEQALLQFQQVVELEPKNAKVWSAVAQIAKQLNDQRTYEAASTLVRQATTFDHQAAATWLAEVAKSNVISSPYSAPLQAPRAAAPPALRPWTPAYFDRRDKFVAEASRHRQFQLMFQQGTPLPNGYGVGLDERCIEYPWFFAVADPAARQYLDAGSALNQEFAVRHPFWSGQRLTLAPLAPADVLVDLPWLASWPGDLRQTDFSTGFFDEIVCLSTLDQVGQAASSFSRDAAKYDNLIETLKELRRVLTPGGRLLLTVPFGKYQHWGEFQQFDSLLLERAANAFGAIRRQERFYRYTSQGWQLARAAAECANLEYAASAVKMQWGAKETAALPEPDGAAAARAVACCIWQRD